MKAALSELGIRVNGVNPGPTATGWTEGRDRHARARHTNDRPLQAREQESTAPGPAQGRAQREAVRACRRREAAPSKLSTIERSWISD